MELSGYTGTFVGFATYSRIDPVKSMETGQGTIVTSVSFFGDTSVRRGLLLDTTDVT